MTPRHASPATFKTCSFFFSPPFFIFESSRIAQRPPLTLLSSLSLSSPSRPPRADRPTDLGSPAGVQAALWASSLPHPGAPTEARPPQEGPGLPSPFLPGHPDRSRGREEHPPSATSQPPSPGAAPALRPATKPPSASDESGVGWGEGAGSLGVRRAEQSRAGPGRAHEASSSSSSSSNARSPLRKASRRSPKGGERSRAGVGVVAGTRPGPGLRDPSLGAGPAWPGPGAARPKRVKPAAVAG